MISSTTPFYQATQAGPCDQWPNVMGFEYYYGFVGGDARQWQPNLFRNTTAIYPLQDTVDKLTFQLTPEPKATPERSSPQGAK